MKTLKLDFRYFIVNLTLKGLSFKALKFTDVGRNLYRSETNRAAFSLDTDFEINGKTAQVKLDYLVKSLKQIDEHVPFDKIKIIGHYSEATAEEILKLVKS